MMLELYVVDGGDGRRAVAPLDGRKWNGMAEIWKVKHTNWS